MTKQQAEWASKHDWYISTQHVHGEQYKVLVEEGEYLEDGQDSYIYYPVEFTDFQKLKEWAGY